MHVGLPEIENEEGMIAPDFSQVHDLGGNGRSAIWG
jgi:hypothetical protein